MPPDTATRPQQANSVVSRWWSPLWEFAVHVFVGTMLFIIIAIPAIGLSLLTKELEKLEVGRFIILGAQGAEYMMFFIDLIMYAVFLLKTAWRLIQRM